MDEATLQTLRITAANEFMKRRNKIQAAKTSLFAIGMYQLDGKLYTAVEGLNGFQEWRTAWDIVWLLTKVHDHVTGVDTTSRDEAIIAAKQVRHFVSMQQANDKTLECY